MIPVQIAVETEHDQCIEVGWYLLIDRNVLACEVGLSQTRLQTIQQGHLEKRHDRLASQYAGSVLVLRPRVNAKFKETFDVSTQVHPRLAENHKKHIKIQRIDIQLY